MLNILSDGAARNVSQSAVLTHCHSATRVVDTACVLYIHARPTGLARLATCDALFVVVFLSFIVRLTRRCQHRSQDLTQRRSLDPGVAVKRS